MYKNVELTFTKEDFLSTRKLAAEYKIPFDQAQVVLRHMYKIGMTISFTSGRTIVNRAAVTMDKKQSVERLRLHPMAHNLFRAEYERMKKAGKLPTKAITFSNAQRNAQKAIENATATLIKIRQAKGKD